MLNEIKEILIKGLGERGYAVFEVAKDIKLASFKADMVVEDYSLIDDILIREVYCHKNNIPSDIVTGERVIIRELGYKDIEAYIELTREEHIMKFISDGRLEEGEERERLEAYIKNIYRLYGFGIWGIFDKNEKRLAGSISVDLLETTGKAEYELGFFMGRAFLRRGYLKESIGLVKKYVFERLSAKRLLALTDIRNKPAINLLKASGFLDKTSSYDKIKDMKVFVAERKEEKDGIT